MAPADVVTNAPRSPVLEQTVEVETPEQVAFSYTVAGIGSRGAAALIDTLIIAAGLIFTFWVLVKVGGSDSAATRATMADSVATAIVLLFAFAVVWGYFVIFEAMWDGQTPGKRRMGIRVVQDGGYSVSFAASAVRNLVRVIDAQPGFVYAVGIVAATLSKSGKRLGDMVAGTIVVQERLVQVAPTLTEPADDTAGISARLTSDEYELLERFLARRSTLEASQRVALAERLADRLREHLTDTRVSRETALARLLASERAARARGVAARGTTGAAREQHALVALGAARWSAFAATLTSARKRGLKAMSEDEVSRFVAQYREVAADLARLKTATAGRDSDALFYLNRLVSGAHNLLYRQRPLTARGIWTFLAVRVPREIRRSAPAILTAAGLMFGPMAASYLAVRSNPSLANQLAPGIIERANRGASVARRSGREYVGVSQLERPVMASQIISNNVAVVYYTFASGVTAGVLTVFLLVTNGVSIGAALAVYASKGIFHQIGEFVLAHSVFELSAICFAGGGALLIAAAIVLPGARTRREALVINGRRALRLIAAATLMLLVAGTIEGLISPRTDVPIGLKVAVAAASVVAMAWWIIHGRGALDEADDGVEEENAYSHARALISR